MLSEARLGFAVSFTEAKSDKAESFHYIAGRTEGVTAAV
jgi:hypothetical protein